jgi:NTE family protein
VQQKHTGQPYIARTMLTESAVSHAVSTRFGLSLALQGGGSFGAFTWGVLDRLLEEQEDSFKLDMVSGASAGAFNAVLLAAGLVESGPERAREKLDEAWHRVSATSLGAALTRAAAVTLRGAAFASPYALNPLGLNPLRQLLEQEVDFERLRTRPPIRLLISATRVSDGHARLFREHEITLDVVLASACLPLLNPPIEIGGEAYWDGGFSANPPLRQLVIDTEAEEILLVRLLPEGHHPMPYFSYEIDQRMREIAFNSSLLQEEQAVQDLRNACAGRTLFRSPLCRKLRRLRFATLAAEDAVPDLVDQSPLDTSLPFLLRLKEVGRRAAEDWLARR